MKLFKHFLTIILSTFLLLNYSFVDVHAENSQEKFSYIVNHYKQNLNNDEYTSDGYDILEANKGETVTANIRSYPGFICDFSNNNSILSGVVNDNNLVLNVYYKIISHDVYFKDGDTLLHKYENVKYGTNISSLKESDPVKTGYKFISWDEELSNTEVKDNDLTIYAHFKANDYTVHFDNKYYSFDRTIESHPYDEEFIVGYPTKYDCEFDGWKITGMDESTHYFDGVESNATEITTFATSFKNLTSEKGGQISFTANWKPKPSVYTINHYQMNTNGKSYIKVASEVLPVEPNSTININDYQKTYTGFIYDGGKGNNSNPTSKPSSFDTTVTIPETGAYDINLYYSRSKHKVTLTAGEKIVSMSIGDVYEAAQGEPGSTMKGKAISKDVFYGEIVYFNAMSSQTFDNIYWTKDSNTVSIGSSYNYTMGDEDVSFVVSANPPGGHLYNINYYLQNVNDDEYTLKETEIFSGGSDIQVQASIKEIPGFTFDSNNSNNIVSGTISNDDNLELKLYYKRNTHTVFYKNGDNVLKKYEGVKYGTPISSLTDKPSYPTRTGYICNSWDVNDYFELQDEDLTINAVFEANQYNILYDLKEGTNGYNNPTTATYDDQFIVNHPTRTDYTFTGWTISQMDSNEHLIGAQKSSVTSIKSTAVLFKNLHATNNATVVFTANWVPNQASYTVKHYLMNMDGTSYSLESTERKKATINSTVTIGDLKKTYAGFTYVGGKGSTVSSNLMPTSFDQNTTIPSDSSRVINIYYSRNKNGITLSKGSGISSFNGGGEHYYGETVYLSANVQSGYTFKGWINNNDSSVLSNSNPYAYVMQDSSISIKASGFSGEGNIYKVNYYLQNLNDDGYTCTKTDELKGEAGSTAVANVIEYTGFTYDSSNSNTNASGTIKNDDSLVLSLYYKRNTYSVSFMNGDNVIKKYDNVKYGTIISSLSDIPSTSTKIGYTFNSWNPVPSSTELLDRDLTINAVFDANKYNISYNLNQGTHGPYHPDIAEYDKTITISNPTREGHSFTGWTISQMDSNEHLIGNDKSSLTETLSSEVLFKNLHATNNATVLFIANWDIEKIKYIVNHYQMDTDGTSYTLESTETYYADYDSTITIGDLKKTYAGFTFEGGIGSTVSSNSKPDSFDETTTVLSDSSRVINLYYSRNIHSITLTGDEGIDGIVGDGNRYYGESVNIAATIKPGYTFANWAKDSTPVSNSNFYQYTMEDEDVTFNASTTVNTDTHYTVKHMLQNIDNNEYTVYETEDLTGVTNGSIEPDVKTYIGFTSPSTQTTTINGDGSTVVEYKYNRHTYSINFDGDNPTSGSMNTQTVRFGQPYILPNNLFKKDNNTFLRWQQGDRSYYIGSPFIIDEAFVTNHKLANNDSLTFKVIWESNEPETEIKDSDFKVGEIQVVTSDKTEFNMKLASDNLKNIIGNVAAAGSVVWLESKKSDDNEVKTSTKTIIEEKTNLNCEIKECLDIKLFSQNKGEDSKNIKEPASSVKITFKLETQENIDAAKAGKLVIYSIHDGVLDPNMIVGTFNEATSEYTFDTNKFSIFALTYLPNGIPKPAGESSNNQNANKVSDKFTPPKTGIY